MDLVDVVAAASGGLSALTALIAVVVAVRSDRRSREVARVSIYLTLREGFRGIYRELGDLEGGNDPEAALRLARQSYWHHAFDEWYVSKLAPREFGDMWETFFRTAVRAGYGHHALGSVLDDLMADRAKGFGAYAGEFVTELEATLAQRASATRHGGEGQDAPEGGAAASGGPRPTA